MLKDLKLELSTAQAITSSSAYSTNTIDLGVEKSCPGANVHGAGYLNVVCVEDAAPIEKNATGTITFSANPTANDTLQIDTTTVTFVSSNPTSSQVLIGEELEDTLDNIIAHSFGSNVTIAVTGDGVITVTAKSAGTTGNSIALAKSSTAITLSGTTLSGGVNTNTVTINLQTSADNSAFSNYASATLVDPKKGASVCIRIPEVKRYIRAHVAGETSLTGGKWDIWVGAPLTDH